jgi:predicted metal-dependent hydrolase
MRFLENHADWIARERERVGEARRTPIWTDGGTLLMRGEPMTIRVVDEDGRRVARYAERAVPIPPGVTDLRSLIQADLRIAARQELWARLQALAAEHQLTIGGFTIRDQRSRWGSCSRSGRIALNYRLLQMPPSVRDYVLVHELMHLKQQNHSRRFWSLVEAACPEYRIAERWLKVHGRGLL